MANTSNVHDHLDAEARIEPKLQFCIFCDIVALDPGKKPVFVGVFDQFRSLGPIPQFFVVVRWIDGLGKHTSTIRLLDPDLQPVFTYPQENEISLSHRAQPADCNFGIINFKFPRSGVYWVEVMLNGEIFSSYPIPVFEK